MNKIEPTRDVFESGRKGLSHHDVRRVNERTVLRVVGFNAGASNAEISRLSGLAPQTVSAILTNLESDGLIKRGEVLRGRRGQPATPILLNENGGFAVGVEIGWRHLDVVLLDMHATVLRHHHAEYAYPDAETVVDRVAGLVAEMTEALAPKQRRRLLDLGIAMPGRVSSSLDVIGAPASQKDLWDSIDLTGSLEQRTGLAVTVLNDGNAGCWAELIALKPPRPADIIYLQVSHFIAAGIVGDGSLWEGPTGNAAELGSILVSPDGRPPEVAHRCASVHALRKRLEEAGHAYSKHLCPLELARPEFEEPIAGWLGTAGKALAQVIFNATTVTEQPLVVLDTVLGPEISGRLVERVREELDRLPTRTSPKPHLIGGQLGHLAPAIGAAELPLFRRYF
jgi:predicted NBD/HSP70 family sugar kinase